MVTVDTALAHLAGAVGRPVWTLLAYAPDWRWMLGPRRHTLVPDDAPLPQPAPNDWASVFSDVRRELEARLAQQGGRLAAEPDRPDAASPAASSAPG